MAQRPCETVEDAAADSNFHTGFGNHRCFILGNKGFDNTWIGDFIMGADYKNWMPKGMVASLRRRSIFLLKRYTVSSKIRRLQMNAGSPMIFPDMQAGSHILSVYFMDYAKAAGRKAEGDPAGDGK